MKSHWSGVFVALGLATTAVLGAQGNPSPANTPPPDAAAPPGVQRTTPQPAEAKSNEAKSNTVTITGCVQDTPMTAAGATNPAPAARQGATTAYFLNNATTDAARDRGAVGTSGLSASGYRLEGDTKLITPHLNHQVRIVGMVQSSSASPTGAANASPGSTAAAPTLRVESVTMLSAKCDEKK
jgi:hypothetical protein